jgi:acetyl esterase/lipase
MHQKFIVTLFISWIVCSTAFSQEKVLYKQIDTTLLYLEVYHPENIDSTISYPGIIFFFGGGWNGGSIGQFKPHAEYFSKRGMICFLADYRVKSRNNTSPFESLKDAKSAIRFVRENAEKFHLNPQMLAASGGSAGGHLAAATAFIDHYNEDADHAEVSCVPNALVLFNPVIDNGPGGYGYNRVGNEYKNFSPLHNITKNAPPTIVFLGTNDPLIPVETVEYYKVVMEKVGSKCELHLYEGQKHGFFNYKNFEYYEKTVFAADNFLQYIGYLRSNPKVKIE